MPTRFVEVVDVGAETSNIVAVLLSRGHGMVGKLSFNVSDYLDASPLSIDRLRDAFLHYNITLDSIPEDWREWAWASSLGSALNQTAVEVPPLNGGARHLVMTGVAMILIREVYVQWKVRSLMRAHGSHVGGGHAHSS